MADTFPRQHARTQRLTLGEPRSLVVSPDNARVVFLRSQAGDDPITCLWSLDLASGEERLVADPRLLVDPAEEADLPAEERARRERAREGAGGVVAFATNRDVTVAAFALGGRLFVAGLVSGRARELTVPGPVFDPRPDPTARRLAYVRGGELVVAELDGTTRVLAGPQPGEDTVTWGSAEFVAAEEMGRSRGYWWSPDGEAIAAARVDVGPVGTWWIADPANPQQPPHEIRYPAAGTPNADVQLAVLRLDGGRTSIEWDREAFPYLADVTWGQDRRLVLTVQSRDQRRVQVLDGDPNTGETSVRFEDHDDQWVELVPGSPSLLDDGRLVVTADRGGARRLLVDGVPVTPPDLQVRSIVATDGTSVVFTANRVLAPEELHVHRWSDATGASDALTDTAGLHSAAAAGRTVVVRSATLEDERSTTRVLGGPVIANHAEVPLVRPAVTLLRTGERSLSTAVLLPSGTDPEDTSVRLPVLVDPYGGPHAQRVVAARSAYLTSQWFADQGFAVVVADGRGTPGRGTTWERAVHRDLATAVLDDQVDALHGAAERFPQLDLERVAIRGWSFGGYLAALAVMRRPDVFHAAIAGAPVTEWRLYDTHYTERYFGLPAQDAEAYDGSSLLVDAERLTRPLLVIHGLADDNVVAAHTLRLSSALLAAGRAHEVLPLPGVTHMTPQEVVAENLLLLQLGFLRRSLDLAGEPQTVS